MDRTAAWNGASKKLGGAFKAGETYSFSANVMFLDGGATDTFYMKLQYKGADGEVYYDSIAEGTAQRGEWMGLRNDSYTIPEGATELVLYLETAGSTNSFYIDEVAGAVEGTEIAGAATRPVRSIILGDVNDDGVVDVFDLAMAKRGLTGSFRDLFAEEAADVDKSGEAEVVDIVSLQRFLLGTIDAFPTAAPAEEE
jgi:hypothetical protein